MAERLHDLLEAGQGIVFLHHALAGWPGWPAWAEVLGGRYHYAPAELRGRCWPDSGFRYAEYTARVVDADHPVCVGVEDFALADELYCCPVFEADVVPLCAPTHRSVRSARRSTRYSERRAPARPGRIPRPAT